MHIKINTNYRNDLHCYLINSIDKNRLSPISSVIDHIVDNIPVEFETEFIDGGTMTRTKLQYKILNNTDKNISVETEYFAVAAKVCSYLFSNGIDYEIELSHQLNFYQKNTDDFAEIYLKTEPNDMVCKKTYGIEDYSSVINCNYVSFTFKFNTSFFQTNKVTEIMIIDALQECTAYFMDDSESIVKEISKNDIHSIKFTKYGLDIILEWLDWHSDILHTPYSGLEGVLLENDLIIDELYA